MKKNIKFEDNEDDFHQTKRDIIRSARKKKEKKLKPALKTLDLTYFEDDED